MVMVPEGENTVPVILLSFGLAETIKEALRGRRQLSEKERLASEKHQALSRQKEAITRDRQILEALEIVFRSVNQQSLEDFAQEDSPLQQLRADLRHVKEEHKKIEQDLQQVADELGVAYKTQNELQREVDHIFDGIFVESHFLEPASELAEGEIELPSAESRQPTPEEISLRPQSVLGKRSAPSDTQSQWSDEKPAPVVDTQSEWSDEGPMPTGLENPGPPSDTESQWDDEAPIPKGAELERRIATHDLLGAYERYHEAIKQLEDRHEYINNLEWDSRQARTAGEDDEHEEEFSDEWKFQQWLLLIQEVKEAEEMVDEARAHAKEIGGVNWDPEGIQELFADDADHDSDNDPELAGRLEYWNERHKSRIERWLESMDETQKSTYMPDSVETDSWDAKLDKSWDTFIVLENNPWKRRKIDRWNQDQRLAWENL